MRVLLETSVLVAGLVEAHARHSHSFAWLQKIRQAGIHGLIAAHSIAEAYAVLSTLPLSPRISPSTSWALLQHSILPFVEPVELSASETQDVVQRLSRQGFAGGVVYDALITEAAVKGAAEVIVTLNVKDFTRVAQGTSLSIEEA